MADALTSFTMLIMISRTVFKVFGRSLKQEPVGEVSNVCLVFLDFSG